MVGVYKIENIINGKSYYGSSKNIEKRWRRHVNELNRNTHHNSILQRAWNKYGSISFKFEVVEICDTKSLLIREQYYLDQNPAYNIGIKSSGGDNLTNNPNRDSIIEKMTNSTRERYSAMTTDEKRKLFCKYRNENPNWRGGSSVSFCKCGSKKRVGAKTCYKCRDRNGKNNPFYGRKHDKEVKLKISLSHVGKYNGNQNIRIIIHSIEYSSYGDASKKLDIPLATIRWRVLSKNPKFKDYIKV